MEQNLNLFQVSQRKLRTKIPLLRKVPLRRLLTKLQNIWWIQHVITIL